MTIVAAWVRQLKAPNKEPSDALAGGAGPAQKPGKKRRTLRELVIASDSRLTGGLTWDCGPKVFRLSRGDAVLAFAGATVFAYPLIAQILAWADDFDAARSGVQDLCVLKGHVQRVGREMLAQFKAKTDAFDWRIDFQLLLAGYSWRERRFMMWSSNVKNGRWTLCVAPGRGVLFLGDHLARAKTRLAQVVGRTAPGQRPQTRSLDWEPLDIIVELIRDETVRTIGGAPQVVKVYEHGNSQQYAVRWCDSITLGGRSLLAYERTQRILLDPDTKKTHHTWDYSEDVWPPQGERKK